MLTMMLSCIISENLYFEEGKNITDRSRETGRDRKTVRLYLEKEDLE